MKTVKKVLIKNYMKGRNTWALFRLSLGWLHIIEKKNENYKSVGAGAHKVGKTVTF